MSVNQITINKHLQYEEKAEESVKRHDKGESWRSIAKSHGFDRDCFIRYLKQHGYIEGVPYENRQIRTPMDVLQKIKEEYLSEGTSISKMASRYGLNRKTVSKDLKMLYGQDFVLQDGKKRVNDNYFSVIDTADKAYWLGFLYADGYNSGDGVEFCLQNEDKQSVEDFKAAVGSMHALSKKKVNFNGSTFINWRISIGSQKMSDDLTKYGCTPNKTYCITFPSFDMGDLFSHFIRGFFDGDGCFYITARHGKKECAVAFTTASFDFAIGFTQFMETQGCKFSVLKVPEKENWIMRLSLKNIVDFYNYIYQGSNEKNRLKRKFEKYTQYLHECRPKTKAV